MPNNDTTRVRLLKNYAPSEIGTWKIFGEDPNCDLGGSHHSPLLETVVGTYSNVVEYAMKLRGFYQWGYGGDIKKLTPAKKTKPKNVDTMKSIVEIQNLEKEKKGLQDRISEIDILLSKLV